MNKHRQGQCGARFPWPVLAKRLGGLRTKTYKKHARHTSSRMMKRTLLTTKGHFLPYRSAAMPKRMDPTALVRVSTIWSGARDRMRLTSKHQHQRNPPGDIGGGFVKGFGEFGHGQRNGEEIESVPGLENRLATTEFRRTRRRTLRHTQAKKATRKKAHCWPFSIAMRRKGFGRAVMGGFKLVKRVRMYWPTDMPWCGGSSCACSI